MAGGIIFFPFNMLRLIRKNHISFRLKEIVIEKLRCLNDIVFGRKKYSITVLDTAEFFFFFFGIND